MLMYGILLASVVFGLVMKPWQRRSLTVAVQPVETTSDEATTAAVQPKLADVVYASEWPSRDPFKQGDEKIPVTTFVSTEDVSISAPNFSLQGIMTVGGELACVIDGATRTVGSSISGWQIEKIEAQGVWVLQGGERHYVPLP